MAKGKKTGGKNWSDTNQPAKRGRKSVPADLRAARSLTKATLEGLINKHLWMTSKQIDKVLEESSRVSMMERMIASIIQKAVIQGDERRLEFILDRLIGKVKDEIDITAYLRKLDGMSDAEVIKLSGPALALLQGDK